MVARGTVLGVNLDHTGNEFDQLGAVVLGRVVELTLRNFFVQAIHVFCAKGRHKRHNFIEDAAEGPYVAFAIIRKVSPNLWTCIVWRTSLSIEKPLLSNFTYIQISQQSCTFFVEKDVSAFNISVENF